MTELKTLKDLKMDAGEVADRVTWGDEIVEVEELKAEAVKIHNLEKESKNVKEFIRWFFNLTKKDLKEKK